jgi:hypothetical protein
MPHLQLGLYYDVYAVYIFSERLFFKPAAAFYRRSDKLGSFFA